MKIKVLIAVFFGLIMNNTAFAETELPGVSEVISASAKLEVVEIDYEKRWVKLKNESGDVEQLDVGDEVRNFDQVKVGDFVDVDYAEAIQVQVYTPDEAEAGAFEDAVFARAKEGEKPGAVAARNVTLVATISGIDLEKNTATLTDKEGNSKTFTPRNPENLKKVKIGDKVMFSYTQALSITVVEK